MSAQTSFSSRLRSGGTFSEKVRVSIVERAKRRAHNALLGLYERKLSSEAISVVEISRRISRDPSRVSRTLNYSSNSTIETLALIAASMGKDLHIEFHDFASKRNYTGLRAAHLLETSGNFFKVRQDTTFGTLHTSATSLSKKQTVQTNSVKVMENV